MFIDALVIARIKILNPRKLIAFVVERIPLVFQQTTALSMDTELSLCKLCSETRTQANVKKLLGGSFDGLVVTAGTFLEVINARHLQIEHFSVMIFDECHHAIRNHPYTQLLKLVKAVPICQRPRLLGLTASQASTSTVETFRKQLDNLIDKFIVLSFLQNLPILSG
jgi:endoribonuclease Dicer